MSQKVFLTTDYIKQPRFFKFNFEELFLNVLLTAEYNVISPHIFNNMMLLRENCF